MQSSESMRITYIDIDELTVDKFNVREGILSPIRQKELVESIKSVGILEPLIVRSVMLSNTLIKYTIVCGSRRFNAAIEAGLTEIPCIIKEMDDPTALCCSLSENVMREEQPTWTHIEVIGRMYELLKGKHSEKVEEISSKMGWTKITVERYIKLFYLPIEIKGLLREPEERTYKQIQSLMQFKAETVDKMSMNFVELITELNDLSIERRIELLLVLVDKKYEMAKVIVSCLKKNPNKSVEELYDENSKRMYGLVGRVIQIHFDLETNKALSDACLTRNKNFKDMVVFIVRQWLIKNGFLVNKNFDFKDKL